ncbi:hypothetical protein ACOSQ4_006501 [Xanthoceras sorbifolium]
MEFIDFVTLEIGLSLWSIQICLMVKIAVYLKSPGIHLCNLKIFTEVNSCGFREFMQLKGLKLSTIYSCKMAGEGHLCRIEELSLKNITLAAGTCQYMGLLTSELLLSLLSSF